MDKLRRIHTRVQPFNDGRQCVEYVKTIENEKICLVVSGSLGQVIVSQIHDWGQIKTIVIFCAEKGKHETWAKKWPKIVGVSADIDSVCRMASASSTENSPPSNTQLDQSFLYTEFLVDILISLDFTEQHFQNFPALCHETSGNVKTEEQYHTRTAIDWYTSKNSLRPMLDRALKTMDIDLMIKCGFFIKDLHNQIKEQYYFHSGDQTFKVYYEQNVSPSEFERIRKNPGELLSFNQFLLTTKNPKMAQQLPLEKNSIRVLFEMVIDPSKVTVPFVLLKDEQILFSTHTVFRIDALEKTQVKLTLTDTRDKKLAVLGEELGAQSHGWIRLGCFLIQLGIIQSSLGKYSDALELCQKGLEIEEKLLPSTDPELAKSYNHIGHVYEQLSNHSMASSYYERAVRIGQQSLPSSHPSLQEYQKNLSNSKNRC